MYTINKSAHTKKVWKLIARSLYIYIYIYRERERERRVYLLVYTCLCVAIWLSDKFICVWCRNMGRDAPKIVLTFFAYLISW